MEFWRIWTAMLTQDKHNAGTDSKIRLKIISGGEEKLNTRLVEPEGDTRPADEFGEQPDQERGEANLYDVRVGGLDLRSEDKGRMLTSITIEGGDAWRPEHIFVWGESAYGREIVPLAIETEITAQLSTDIIEGADNLSIRSVGTGDRNTLIRRVVMLILTEGTSEETGNVLFGNRPNPVFGTDDPMELVISDNIGPVLSEEIHDTSQTDLNSGHANYYTATATRPFKLSDLNEDSVVLKIKGRDNWFPKSFFLFGMDTASGKPQNIIPMVHLSYWPFGIVSADASTGVAQQVLPLLPADKPGIKVLKPTAPGNQTII